MSVHSDDEIYGAFSFLKDSHVVYCALDESSCPPDPTHRIGPDEKTKEIEKVSRFAGFTWSSYGFRVNELYLVKYDLIWEIERTINKLKPDTILIPYPSINQDHQTVYEACMVALRQHDKNHWVKNVVMYECPQSFQWGTQMEANYFRPIDIKRKLQGYNLYKSQMRSYRSEKLIEDMAKFRGRQANMKGNGVLHCEGYRILRMVDAKEER